MNTIRQTTVRRFVLMTRESKLLKKIKKQNADQTTDAVLVKGNTIPVSVKVVRVK
jgi:hypothetical protein